jgi:deoxyribodipyrimidine photolyase-related protein
MKLLIIITNQLFENSPIFDYLEENDEIILYEHPVHFTDFNYHKMKLVMHRASMKVYYDYLEKNVDNKIKYLEFNDSLEKEIKKYKNLEKIIVYNPIDHHIMNEYLEISKKNKIELELFDNPGNICKLEDYQEYITQSKNKNPFFHHSFYVWCRRKYEILIKNNEPIGDKWSFDNENRLPFPKNYKEDVNFKVKENKYLKEAKKYVNKNFKNNHGSDEYYLPIDFSGAKAHLKKFLKERLNNFGPYEDAVSEKIIFGTHSVLSPLINIGLITPNYIIEEVHKFYKENKVKIQSVEGYIRQLFWREFCILVYFYKYNELDNMNYFNHKNKLDKTWYNGETSFKILNDLIEKALKYGWLHHIERLMYIGNFMLITKTNPKDVYKWFMELFIDAYPWVMYPNIYGMSQHSAGPIMMKRPYFSSSNYIDKMSTYKKKEGVNKILIENKEYEWYETWDGLYYNFINDNSKILEKNYSTANIVSIWKKKSKKDRENLLDIANKYIKKYN